MTPAQMLRTLSEHGDTGYDYHDGLDGWFSWHVNSENTELRIRWEAADDDGGFGPAGVHRWKLTLAE